MGRAGWHAVKGTKHIGISRKITSRRRIVINGIRARGRVPSEVFGIDGIGTRTDQREGNRVGCSVIAFGKLGQRSIHSVARIITNNGRQHVLRRYVGTGVACRQMQVELIAEFHLAVGIHIHGDGRCWTIRRKSHNTGRIGTIRKVCRIHPIRAILRANRPIQAQRMRQVSGTRQRIGKWRGARIAIGSGRSLIMGQWMGNINRASKRCRNADRIIFDDHIRSGRGGNIGVITGPIGQVNRKGAITREELVANCRNGDGTRLGLLASNNACRIKVQRANRQSATAEVATIGRQGPVTVHTGDVEGEIGRLVKITCTGHRIGMNNRAIISFGQIGMISADGYADVIINNGACGNRC